MTISYSYLPMLIGGLVAALGAYLLNRLVFHAKAQPEHSVAPVSPLEHLHHSKPRERRRDARRRGNCVDVDLIDPSGEVSPLNAFVTDRSRGGVGLQVNSSFAVGTILHVRPRTHDNRITVAVEVRSCRPLRDSYILGCRFMEPPSWNIMLLFG